MGERDLKSRKMHDFTTYSLLRFKVPPSYDITVGHLLVKTELASIKVWDEHIFRDAVILLSIWVSACQKIYYIVATFGKPSEIRKVRGAG